MRRTSSFGPLKSPEMSSNPPALDQGRHSDVPSPRARINGLLLAGWLLVGGAAALVAAGARDILPALENLLQFLGAHVAQDKVFYSPLAYFCLFSLVYLLERHIPARPRAVFSAGLFLDAGWYVATMLFRLAFLGAYVALLHQFYQHYLSFLTIEAVAQWGELPRLLLAVVVADFLRWLSHLVRHKVPLFWAFHAVHHSQVDLNLFTDARVHPVDRMVSATIRFIPLLMLGIELPVILAWAVFETIYPKFYHANVKLNFGRLRYLLVTPQSHRVHHAVAPEYRDRNFGYIFSVWDRLFGTQHPDSASYPETGIADPAYPLEADRRPHALAMDFLRQLIYPFETVIRPRRSKARGG
jgi:sterol desaturase/sphingolipid hydroxylase (fatty acid hydroxylase superfamily)